MLNQFNTRPVVLFDQSKFSVSRTLCPVLMKRLRGEKKKKVFSVSLHEFLVITTVPSLVTQRPMETEIPVRH